MPRSISLLEDDEGNRLFVFNGNIELDNLPPSIKAKWEIKLQHQRCHIIPILEPGETVH